LRHSGKKKKIIGRLMARIPPPHPEILDTGLA
jgi:hypothetical protein